MAFALAGCICYVFRRAADGRIEKHWLSGPPPRGCLEDDFSNFVSYAEWGDWSQLANTAHAAQHHALAAADLEGRRVGDAFIEFVIRDPRARACVEWLSLEFPAFSSLLSDGKFPSPLTNSQFGPPLIFEGVKWPTILDRDKLYQEIVRIALDGDWWTRPLPPRDQTNSLFDTAEAIADQHKAFFDLLRGDELTAEGTSEATFSVQSIQRDQWGRPDRYLDVQLNDLLSREGPRSLRKICTGIKLSSVPEPAKLPSDDLERFRLWVRRRRLDQNNHPTSDELQLISLQDLAAHIDPDCAHQMVRELHGVKGVLASDILTSLARGWRPTPPRNKGLADKAHPAAASLVPTLPVANPNATLHGELTHTAPERSPTASDAAAPQTRERTEKSKQPPEKTWRAKRGEELTASDAAVLDALNALWPDGKLDHKAKARDDKINKWLKDNNKSGISTRAIQRALKKIRFS
jgi:hypothetical protein